MIEEYVRRRLVMPAHEEADGYRPCGAERVPGYVQPLRDGTWHCNLCGAVIDPRGLR